MFSASNIHSLTALLSLILPFVYLNKTEGGKTPLLWMLLGASFAGSSSWTLVQIFNEGALSLSTAIWLSISVSIGCFLMVVAISNIAWRFSILLLPYFALLAVIAILWQAFPANSTQLQTQHQSHDVWMMVHISLSIVTYAFLTLAAIAGLAAYIVERTLIKKKPTAFSRKLPSVIDSEALLFRFLLSSALILCAGIASGMGASHAETGELLVFDHKTILTFGALAAISVLLYSHHQYGTRGKTATRLVLMAYLLITLGFLGVKFVTDVIMA